MFFSRLDASRALAFAGLLFLALAMLLGEIYAIYISHVANGIIRQSWTTVMQATAQVDISLVNEQFAIINDLTAKRGRVMSTHSHIGAFGLLAMLLAIIQPAISFAARHKRYLAWLFICGAVLQFSGLYLAYYLGEWILYLSDIGGLIVTIVIAANLYGLLHATTEEFSLAEIIEYQIHFQPAPYLLKAGILLMLLGMIFGIYHAWQLVSTEEKAVFSAMDNTIENIIAGDIESAKAYIADFKKQQSKNAITTAAHSHAIEFGMLMILLAFIQGLVMLQQKWREHWAKLLITGAFLLPVCVFLATKYGLPAAAMADLSGALVFLALFAYSIGILRYTGAADVESGESD